MNREQRQAHLMLHGFTPCRYPMADPSTGFVNLESYAILCIDRCAATPGDSGVFRLASPTGFRPRAFLECPWGALTDAIFYKCWYEFVAINGLAA